jgi:Flagellar hook-length control protein FliK
MTVGKVDAASQAVVAQRRTLQVGVGQILDIKVLRQLELRKYLVVFGGEQHIVETSMSLMAGRTIRTSVAAVGDKLELKYVGMPPAAEDEPSAPEGDLLTDLENRHAVSLSEAQRTAITHAMNAVPEPQLTAGAGLYLSKLALPLEADALDALYRAQTWQPPASAATGLANTVPRTIAEFAAASATTPLATMLRRAVNLQADSAPPDVGDSLGNEASMPAAQGLGFPITAQDATERDSHDGARKDDLAHQLLNEPDGGSVAYHYGTLPVMIADQLVELDLVYFRERLRTEGSSNTRRLVMTFKTENLGRVQIVAQALAEHLSVEISSETPDSNAALAAHSQDVTDLLARLGWNVDAVKYELRPDPPRAASHVIAHVLNADTLNRWV